MVLVGKLLKYFLLLLWNFGKASLQACFDPPQGWFFFRSSSCDTRVIDLLKRSHGDTILKNHPFITKWIRHHFCIMLDPQQAPNNLNFQGIYFAEAEKGFCFLGRTSAKCFVLHQKGWVSVKVSKAVRYGRKFLCTLKFGQGLMAATTT